MFSKVTPDRLARAGFKLEKCEDGTFWVIEREPGAEADRLLRICDMTLINFDAEAVSELILVQCGCDLTDPTLYIDGYLWKLTKRDLADIVTLLLRDTRGKRKKSPAPEQTPKQESDGPS